MSQIAVVFSGQGAQSPCMGKNLYDNFEAAKKIFKDAEDIAPGITDMCFNGSKEELGKTINTQPCVYTVSMAAAAVLKEKRIKAGFAAGFSLGEMAALSYSGAFSFIDGLKLVMKRAALMNECVKANPGTMSAVLKLNDETVIKLCEKAGVYAVNFNCPNQITCAGGTEEMSVLNSLVAQNGGKALPLAVSGAFHSPFMKAAGEKYFDIISKVNIKKTGIPVYSNITAAPFSDISKECSQQIYSPVLWQKIIEKFYKLGVTSFIETGPGKVLCGLIFKTCPDVKVYSAENKDGIAAILQNF